MTVLIIGVSISAVVSLSVYLLVRRRHRKQMQEIRTYLTGIYTRDVQ